MIHACRCHKTPHVNHSPNCIVVINPSPYILYDMKVVHCSYELIHFSPLIHVQAKATLKVLSPKNLLYWRERLPAKAMMWQTQRGVARMMMRFQLDDPADNCGSPWERCQGGGDMSSSPMGKPPPFASIGSNRPSMLL
jgi:hypothetical protein